MKNTNSVAKYKKNEKTAAVEVDFSSSQSPSVQHSPMKVEECRWKKHILKIQRMAAAEVDFLL